MFTKKFPTIFQLYHIRLIILIRLTVPDMHPSPVGPRYSLMSHFSMSSRFPCVPPQPGVTKDSSNASSLGLAGVAGVTGWAGEAGAAAGVAGFLVGVIATEVEMGALDVEGDEVAPTGVMLTPTGALAVTPGLGVRAGGGGGVASG